MSFFLANDHLPLALVLTALIGGYLSGSVPFGFLLTQLAGKGDIRNAGSGNIGATNVLRVGGKKLGAMTLLLDMMKGFVPVIVAKQWGMDYAVLAAFGAFFGHLFPVWLKFRGGKGVATGIGVLLGLWWQLGVAIMCIWILMLMMFRMSSLAALAAFALAPLLAGVLSHDMQMMAVSLLIALFIWARHHENLRRIANGTEERVNLGGKKDVA